MKSIFDLYAENHCKTGFAVRMADWDSGFALIRTIDGRSHGEINTRATWSPVVIATIVSRAGVSKQELDRAGEPVWEIVQRAY